MLSKSQNTAPIRDKRLDEEIEYQLLILVHHKFMRLANQALMSTLGITFSLGSAMLHLEQSPSVSFQGLAAFFGCGTGRISRLVRDLESQGLVSTWRAHLDKRAVQLVLTPAGRQLVLRIPAVLRQAEQQMLRNLTGNEREKLQVVIAGMVARFDQTRKTTSRI